MKRIICAVLCAVIFLMTAVNVNALDDGVLPSGVKYSEISDRIDEFVQKHSDHLAGMSIAVVKNYEVLFKNFYGYADIENGVKNDISTVMEWGSITKLLVWISVMQQVELGNIDLDEDILAYLPEDFFSRRRYEKPITMYNLMNHDAGWEDVITDLFTSPAIMTDEHFDLGEILKINEPEQINEPGDTVAYSNWGAALAGYIVECVTGVDFYKYVRKNIFDKIGIEDAALYTDLSDNEEIEAKRHLLKCYDAAKGTNSPLGECFYNTPIYPAGMCTGTLDELIKLVQVLLPPEGQKCVLFEHPDTLDELLSVTKASGEVGFDRFAHGFWILHYGVDVYGHAGNTAGCSSMLAIDPKSGIGAVVMTNQHSEKLFNYTMLQEIVFGSYSVKNSDMNLKAEEGYYRRARTREKGIFNLYKIMNLVNLKEIENGVLLDKISGSTYTPAGDNLYITEDGLLVGVVKDGKSVRLCSDISDYKKLSTFQVYAEYALIAIFVLSVIFCIFVILVYAVQAVKKKKIVFFDTMRSICCLAVVSSAFNVVTDILKLLTYSISMATLKKSALLNVGFIAVMLVYDIFFIIRVKKKKLSKKEMTVSVLVAVCTMIAIFSLVYWNFVDFL